MKPIKLDEKDKKILYELDKNSRQGISSIAKKVRLSKEVVNYRIKNLEKRKIIKGYYAVLDIAKLGYMYCRFFLKFSNLTPKKENEILNYAKQHKNIGWIVIPEGRWDMVLVIWAKDAMQLKNVCDEFTYNYSSFIQEKYVSIATKIHHFPRNYLFNTNDISSVIMGGEVKHVRLDEIDYKLLGLLAKNARRTNAELGKKLNLDANTIKYRIKKLLNEKVILSFRIALNTELLGYQHYKIFLMLQKINEENIKELMMYLKTVPNVIYITESIGIADLEFEMQVKTPLELHDFMRNLKKRFSIIMKNYDPYLVYDEMIISYLPEYSLS